MWTCSNINTVSSRSVPANQQGAVSILSVSLMLGKKKICNFLQKFIVVTATGNMHHPTVGGPSPLF